MAYPRSWQEGNDMNGTEPKTKWLAGWYVRPDDAAERYDSRHHDGPLDWPQAAAWLREQLHGWHEQWGNATVTTRHIDRGAKDVELSFPDCRAFIEWAMVNRRGRGVWGFDGKRYFYIIHADNDGSGDRARLPVDPTTQLAAIAEQAPARQAAPAQA